MNAISGDSDQEVRLEALRSVAQTQFCIEVLKKRSSSELSGFLWRIKLKVANHMCRVLVRRIAEFDGQMLAELSRDEQQQLLETHPLLQSDLPKPVSADLKPEWQREVEAKVVRFADRMQSRRASG